MFVCLLNYLLHWFLPTEQYPSTRHASAPTTFYPATLRPDLRAAYCGGLPPTGSSIHSHQIINHIRHSRPLPGILMPHPLHQGNRFNTPMFLQTSGWRSSMFRTNCIIDVMFIMSFPGVFLSVSLLLLDLTSVDKWWKKEASPSPQSIQTSFPRKPSQPRKRRLCNHKMVWETIIPELANWPYRQENESSTWWNSWLGLNRNRQLSHVLLD